MISSISNPALGGAPGAAAAMKRPPEARLSGGETRERSREPVLDTYIPEEQQEPSGRYWLGRDEDGQPKVCFDDPEKESAEDKKAETCTGSTDRVDREVERLKKEKEQLERQINSEADEAKKKELEAKLSQVDNELRQKDNDSYRRRHTVFS